MLQLQSGRLLMGRGVAKISHPPTWPNSSSTPSSSSSMTQHTCFLGRQIPSSPAQQRRVNHVCRPCAQAVAAPPKFNTSTSEKASRVCCIALHAKPERVWFRQFIPEHKFDSSYACQRVHPLRGGPYHLAGLQIFDEAQSLLPGGVNSPVRAFKSVGGKPIVFDHVKGPYCFDVDGNK